MLHSRAGRWGNAKSPAYGTLSDYQFMRRHSASQKWLEKAKSAWGASLSSADDVIAVFVNYCSGKSGMNSQLGVRALYRRCLELQQQTVGSFGRGHIILHSA